MSEPTTTTVDESAGERNRRLAREVIDSHMPALPAPEEVALHFGRFVDTLQSLENVGWSLAFLDDETGDDGARFVEFVERVTSMTVAIARSWLSASDAEGERWERVMRDMVSTLTDANGAIAGHYTALTFDLLAAER